MAPWPEVSQPGLFYLNGRIKRNLMKQLTPCRFSPSFSPSSSSGYTRAPFFAWTPWTKGYSRQGSSLAGPACRGLGWSWSSFGARVLLGGNLKTPPSPNQRPEGGNESRKTLASSNKADIVGRPVKYGHSLRASCWEAGQKQLIF